VRSFHSASTVPLQLQPSYSCNEETNEQIHNIACVTLTHLSPSWGWFVVIQNVPVYLLEAPAHLTNILKFTAYPTKRVNSMYGQNAGILLMLELATNGKTLKSVPSNPRMTVSLTEVQYKFHVCRLSITSQLFIHSTKPPYRYYKALRSESTGCSQNYA
jgi:hypothetical protein